MHQGLDNPLTLWRLTNHLQIPLFDLTHPPLRVLTSGQTWTCCPWSARSSSSTAPPSPSCPTSPSTWRTSASTTLTLPSCNLFALLPCLIVLRNTYFWHCPNYRYAILPFCVFIAPPLVGFFADKLGNYVRVLLLSIVGSVGKWPYQNQKQLKIPV